MPEGRRKQKTGDMGDDEIAVRSGDAELITSRRRTAGRDLSTLAQRLTNRKRKETKVITTRKYDEMNSQRVLGNAAAKTTEKGDQGSRAGSEE